MARGESRSACLNHHGQVVECFFELEIEVLGMRRIFSDHARGATHQNELTGGRLNRRGANKCRRKGSEFLGIVGRENLPGIVDRARKPIAVEKVEDQIFTGVADPRGDGKPRGIFVDVLERLKPPGVERHVSVTSVRSIS